MNDGECKTVLADFEHGSEIIAAAFYGRAVQHAVGSFDERAKLLRSIRTLKPEEVATHAVKGQYGPAVIGGASVPGFRQEQGVAADLSALPKDLNRKKSVCERAVDMPNRA